jgi:hypothetical protein
MAYVSITGDYLLGKRKQASLEQVREAVRQKVRDSNLNQLSKAMMQAMVDRSYTMEALQALCKSYGIKGYEGELFMDKSAEIQLIKDQQAALSKRLEKLEYGKWGKEPANGGMFKIEKSYAVGGAKYKFLAIREAGLWYLTGTGVDGSKSYSWSGLQAFAGKYSRVWRLTVAEELLD